MMWVDIKCPFLGKNSLLVGLGYRRHHFLVQGFDLMMRSMSMGVSAALVEGKSDKLGGVIIMRFFRIGIVSRLPVSGVRK